MVSGNQNPPSQDGDYLFINMVKSEVNVATQSRDYISPQTVPSLESHPPLEMPLNIGKTQATVSYSERSNQVLYSQS